MTDISLALDSNGYFDLILESAVDGLDLSRDDDLQTAVAWSLFVDRRADSGDRLPTGQDDRRGWCLDYLNDNEDDRIGSRLWLIQGAKSFEESRRSAEDIGAEALSWLLSDRVAREVAVTASLQRFPFGKDADVTTVLSIDIAIVRSDERRWQHVWRIALDG